nr:hypothetical protein [Acinetobacter sp. Marseille-Q1620]
MSNNIILKSKIMKFCLIIFLVLILAVIVLYFQPDNKKEQKLQHVTENNALVHDNHNEINHEKEEVNTQDTLLDQHNTSNNSSENNPLYDTKSDLTIQPIDPEKDPANQIDEK